MEIIVKNVTIVEIADNSVLYQSWWICKGSPDKQEYDLIHNYTHGNALVGNLPKIGSSSLAYC